MSASHWTEANQVQEWGWSKGFSPAINNETMTMAVMIREADSTELVANQAQ